MIVAMNCGSETFLKELSRVGGEQQWGECARPFLGVGGRAYSLVAISQAVLGVAMGLGWCQVLWEN
jgi:hypothetical protein